MPSPFPGMDPYLEAPERWQDVHADLAAEIRTALNRLIQPRYFARLNASLVYDRGAYAGQIDYSQPPPPPALPADEAALVATLLRAYRTGGETRDREH